MERIQVRCSSLGALAACPRHFAANRFPEALLLAHPDTASVSKPGAYKPWVGTAFHLCLEKNYRSATRIETAAEETFAEPQEDEDFFDEKFTETDQLKELVKEMVFTFRKSPHSLEWTLKRHGNRYEVEEHSDEIDSGITLTGHIDCVRSDGMVIDLKTGVTTDQNLYQEQLTAYRILMEHAGIETPKHADVVKVSRPTSPKRRTPISVKRYRIDTQLHEERTITLVKQAADLVSQKEKWYEDFTVIPGNPASRACAYCKLKNTSACPETLREELAE